MILPFDDSSLNQSTSIAGGSSSLSTDACQGKQIAPHSYGVLRCSAILWPDCPFYNIRHQSHVLVISPQTFANVDDEKKKQISFMSNGDGIFLSLKPCRYSTYICVLKNVSEVDEETEGEEQPCPTNADKEYLTAVDKYIVVQGYDVQKTTLLSHNQNWQIINSIFQNKVRPFSDYGRSVDIFNITEEAVANGPSAQFQDVYSPKWIYNFDNQKACQPTTKPSACKGAPANINNSASVASVNASDQAPTATPPPGEQQAPSSFVSTIQTILAITEQVSSFVRMPCISGIDGIQDPIDLMFYLQNASANTSPAANGAKEITNRITKEKGFRIRNINPGLHWGLQKVVPLLSNQGFHLRFKSLAPQPYKIANPNHQYELLPEFDWLDPLVYNLPSRCELLGQKSAEAKEKLEVQRLRDFNLSTQQYIIVQFPPDYDDVPPSDTEAPNNENCPPKDAETISKGNTRQLYLLLIETLPPIICRSLDLSISCNYQPPANASASAAISIASASTSVGGIAEATTDQEGYISQQFQSEFNVHELSRCDFVTSAALFAAKDLTINFRVQSGKLVINFDVPGLEDKHWVVRNYKTVEVPPQPAADGEPADSVKLELKREIVPFNFSKDLLKVYGGNKKIAFGYGPLTFNDTATLPIEEQVFFGAPGASLSGAKVHALLSDGIQPYTPKKFTTNFSAQYRDFSTQTDPLDALRNAEDSASGDASTSCSSTNSDLDYLQNLNENFGKDTVFASVFPSASNDAGLAAAGAAGGGAAGGMQGVLSSAWPSGTTDCVLPADKGIVYNRPENLLSSYDTQISIVMTSEKKANGSDPYAIKVGYNISLTAGGIVLPVGPKGEDGFEEWLNAETPVLRQIHFYVPPEGSAWQAKNLDVGKYVLSFSDSWEHSDFHKVSHSGSISFYIPRGPPLQSSDAALIENLKGILDRNTYIRIALWWDQFSGVGVNQDYMATMQPKNEQQGFSPGGAGSGLLGMPGAGLIGADPFADYGAESTPGCPNGAAAWPSAGNLGKGQLDYNVMFTGFLQGGSLRVEAGKTVLTCQLQDYGKIMEESKFFNAPFFDRMNDNFAVREIMSLVNFKLGGIQPMAIVDESCLGSLDDPAAAKKIKIDAQEEVEVTRFRLPGSYNQLEEPAQRPPDNSSYYDRINIFAKMAAKTYYFDALGRFRYVDMPFEKLLMDFSATQGAKTAAFTKIIQQASKYGVFVSSFKRQSDQLSIDTQDGLTGTVDTDHEILLIESYDVERGVSDVYNSIIIISSTPNGEMPIGGDINYPSIYDSSSVGFLGYKKMFVQMDGLFGSEITVKQMVNHYTKIYVPPLRAKFKYRGYRCMVAMMPVLFNPIDSDKAYPLIISKVSNEIDIRANKWTQSIEGEWLFQGKGVSFGETKIVPVGINGPV